MTKNEFCRAIERCRKAQEKANELQTKLFIMLGEYFPDVDFQTVESKAENADNVSDAISCYIQYGEYTPEEICNEIGDNLDIIIK